MNKLFYDGTNALEIPAKWEECERWQLASLVEHMHQAQDLMAHKLLSFLILSATKDHLQHQLIIASLSDEERHDAAKFMTYWLYEKPIFIRHNPFPKFKGYFGPGADFKYVYFEEFIKAEKFYTAYAKEHKPEDLDSLVACLYRPKRWPWAKSNPLNPEDPRELYTAALFEVMKEKVASWPNGLKLSIFYYFDSCLQILVKNFPWAFEPGEKLPPKIKNDSPKTLYHIARELAKGIELEKVLLRPIVPVFFELNESRIDAEKLKIEMNKNKQQ
ncbi:hypothetical protein PBT90_16780 [Algoriphagus halophytocola]|uniref:hypothetical protein n=1 Tax=Algoriphagus halophytocola TaxID=2991499 RepID=UPI0022DE8EC6|nr:hypothetical protein [Algoriphagus sp. TR-M9]WBL42393.1 hypothetical protein PBT90_16780 [Algoriphagus sp. TR-M9]